MRFFAVFCLLSANLLLAGETIEGSGASLLTNGMVRVELGGDRHVVVQLAGVALPEPKQPHHFTSMKALRKLLRSDTVVRVQVQTVDPYGIIVGQLHCKGVCG